MSEITDARLEAAEALREVGHAFSARDVDDATLQEVTRAARAILPLLEDAPRRSRRIPSFDEILEVAVEPGEARRYAMADRAVVGPANPASVDVDMVREDEVEGVATVVFGPTFEGALGRVHGGMVAAVFDDLAGFVLGFVGRPGYSVRLDVTYRKPVPTEVPVEFRVRMQEQRGRKILVAAEARLDGEVLATAEATMVTVAQEHFETHARDHLVRSGDESD